MVSLTLLMITAGTSLADVVDLAFSASGQWRWILGISAVPTILLGPAPLFCLIACVSEPARARTSRRSRRW